MMCTEEWFQTTYHRVHVTDAGISALKMKYVTTARSIGLIICCVGAVLPVLTLVECCREGILHHQPELFLLPMRGGNVLLYKLFHPHGPQLH